MVPTIRIDPSDSMFDYPRLNITITDLKRFQAVTVICVLRSSDASDTFVSSAYYVANELGTVNCSKDASIGGSYTGVEPVGLLLSLRPAPGSRKGAAFGPSDVFTPIVYQFYVKNGHSNFNWTEHILCNGSCRRHFLHPGISRIEVESGRIRGTLFKPIDATTSNRCHAIIDLYGTRGGIMEHRAALIASHGYVSMALAYFRYKDLPDSLDSQLDLEYFEEAIEYLLNLPYVNTDGVAIIGSSLGGDVGMLVASVCRKVKAVVSINGYHMLNEMWPFKYKGITLPFKKGTFTDQFLEHGNVNMRAYRSSLSDDVECIYPLENSHAHFLFVCAEKDQNTDAVHSTAVLMNRLRAHGKERNGEVLLLPGAGHLLEPPYSPHAPLAFNKSYNMFVLFGGQTIDHAKGQVVMWKKTFEFFQRRLGPPLIMRMFKVVKAISRL